MIETTLQNCVNIIKSSLITLARQSIQGYITHLYAPECFPKWRGGFNGQNSPLLLLPLYLALLLLHSLSPFMSYHPATWVYKVQTTTHVGWSKVCLTQNLNRHVLINVTHVAKCFANRYAPRNVLPLCLIFGHFKGIKWLTVRGPNGHYVHLCANKRTK